MEVPKLYLGTKLVKASPMTRGDYNFYRGWDMPEGEMDTDEGYLIEYTEGGDANHGAHRGYISWSPKAVFEKSYHTTETGMTFGMAIDAMIVGKKVARLGWNGKDMWICLSGPLLGREIAFENFWSKPCSEFAQENGGSAKVLPCINMKTAGGEILMGWLASQTDMLASDWMIVD